MRTIRARLWWILVGLVAAFGLFAVGDAAMGLAFEPRTLASMTGLTAADIEADNGDVYRFLDYLVRVGGITFAALAAVMAVTLLIPYRAARRWAWWTMWVFPGWMAAVLILNLAIGTAAGRGMSDSALSAPVIGLISAAVLLLDRYRFADDGTSTEAAPQRTA